MRKVCIGVYVYIHKEGLNMSKTRHNITISEEKWAMLSLLKKALDKSYSELIEEAISEYLENRKINKVYLQLMSVPFCDKEENEALTRELDSLTEEDLEVVKVEEL